MCIECRKDFESYSVEDQVCVTCEKATREIVFSLNAIKAQEAPTDTAHFKHAQLVTGMEALNCRHNTAVTDG